MNWTKPISRKGWFLLLCAAVLLAWPLIGSWTTLTGTKNAPNDFLDAVVEDLKHNPLVSIVRVDHDARQIVVQVKPTHKTLTFSLTRVGPRTLADGQPGEECTFEWKDEGGRVLAFGHGLGARSKSFHVEVPGLP